jgi:AraC family transcriptional regulator of adaptative response / DNA-3-methyladenine glycosylase II
MTLPLDPETCDRARLSRDPRFDGRFFVAVITTGVFCRPICPARRPNRKNVRYFRTAGACSEAGFRPCLKCRPESAPGSPPWNGASTTVARTLRLVGEGVHHGRSLRELASQLGVTERHVRRLFVRYLGAPPRAIAMTERLLFAKKLLDETGLPVAQIALASGFGSVRSFNDAFRKTYRRTPREVRTHARSNGRGAGSAGWTLKLGYRPPLDWSGLTGFLAPRATPGVERVEGETYARTIVMDDRPGAIVVHPHPGAHALALTVHHPEPRTLFDVARRVRGMFDLDADTEEIREHLGSDPILAPAVAARRGLRVPGAWDGFELTVRAILGQQVSIKGATTLTGRLVRAYGRPVAVPEVEGLDRLFPGPSELSAVDPAAVGIPAARARTIERLAAAVARGEIAFDDAMPPETVRERLTGVAGIGEWTAEYVAMRALRDPDAFPASDLGLLNAVSAGGERAAPATLRHLAQAWRPWRAYAAIYLWSRP